MKPFVPVPQAERQSREWPGVTGRRPCTHCAVPVSITPSACTVYLLVGKRRSNFSQHLACMSSDISTGSPTRTCASVPHLWTPPATGTHRRTPWGMALQPAATNLVSSQVIATPSPAPGVPCSYHRCPVAPHLHPWRVLAPQ